jgi:hypothetical protein
MTVTIWAPAEISDDDERQPAETALLRDFVIGARDGG